MDHITVLPHDNEILRPTAHVYDAVKQLLLVYDNKEEAAARAETAYKMVHNNLIWTKQINPQWVKLFDEITAGTAAPQAIANQDLTLPVIKGEML
ncbi:hypothetical protein LCGC14_2588210 [marine sediment metagenome]|uniref:Uncharacterized protein n=1 Tax=marine sediment metagenome TaxID=412755 RepID=A0A0F9CNK6_9ZZZZ